MGTLHPWYQVIGGTTAITVGSATTGITVLLWANLDSRGDLAKQIFKKAGYKIH